MRCESAVLSEDLSSPPDYPDKPQRIEEAPHRNKDSRHDHRCRASRSPHFVAASMIANYHRQRRLSSSSASSLRCWTAPLKMRPKPLISRDGPNRTFIAFSGAPRPVGTSSGRGSVRCCKHTAPILRRARSKRYQPLAATLPELRSSAARSHSARFAPAS